ncbi:MAG: VPLPA-CTERM sorting domain-containing protein [Gammaproteobacteria bacterium]
MKIMITTVRTWLTAAGVLLLGGFAAPSFAYSVVPDFNVSDPDVPDAGFPHVENSSVKVTLKRNGAAGWKLTAANNASSTFKVQVNPATAHNVTGSKSFQLTSLFNNAFNFTTGSVLIKGMVPGLGINSSQTLWSASLSDFGFDFNPNDGSPVSLGWKTNGPTGKLKDLYDPLGIAESVYLYAFNPSSFAFGRSLSINAKAITTVPIPAAGWLLGSALVSLAGVMRRRASAFA